MAMVPALPSADVILLAAAALGEVAVLQRLIDHKTVNIDGDGERTTALMAAAAAGQDEAMKLLLRHVRNIDISDRQGNIALQLAVWFATESTIRLLLPRSTVPITRSRSQPARIETASASRHRIDWKEAFYYLNGGSIVDTARIIFEYMKPGDVEPRGHFVPLMFFIDNGCNAIALKIIEQGIGLDSRDERGFTPLMLAARKGELTVVRALVHAGVDLEVRSGADWQSALSLAVFYNRNEVVQCLLAAGANPDVPAAELAGESFLIHAVWHKHLDVVRSLLDADVNVNTCGGADDYTPLRWAVLGGSFDAVRLLLSHGAKVQRDSSGKDPLNLAVIFGFELIAALLVEAGAPVDELDRHGRTILARAASRGMPAFVRVLLDEGVRVNSPDRRGRTPFLTAACRGHYEIARLLL
ncbi:hypothetical protein CDV55_102791 [Aspergillus turcosus]|nr:hypothetical protein CDV55_102791 [Aspergillus turcosus]